MSYSLEFEPDAIDDLEQLDEPIRVRILTKLNWLSNNFEQIKPQALTGDLSDFFKLRVGDYRVLYDFNRLETRITVIRVRHRSQVYL